VAKLAIAVCRSPRLPESPGKMLLGSWIFLWPRDLCAGVAGHAGVVVDDCLYVFGGTTLDALLSDLAVFCVSNATWRRITRWLLIVQSFEEYLYSLLQCSVDEQTQFALYPHANQQPL